GPAVHGGSGAMRCDECGGLMCYERYYGSGADLGESVHFWRCIFCGKVYDAQTLENRMKKRRRRERLLPVG
ncbi:MAG: hypothetical protein ACE5JJ_10630, partial [Nitrospinota bacterium]